MGALAHLVETRGLLSDETLLCSSRQTWSGAPVAHFFEVAEAQGAAVSKNNTCGIRAHAGRPHGLSRPTPYHSVICKQLPEAASHPTVRGRCAALAGTGLCCPAKRRPALSSQGLTVANACVACKHADPQGAPTFKGTWCSGITSASHVEGPGLNPQCVHSTASVLEWRRTLKVHLHSRAHGVVVSHPLRMRKALGSIPSVSILLLVCWSGAAWLLRDIGPLGKSRGLKF